MKRPVQIIVILLITALSAAYGQESQIRFDVSCSIDWARGELTALASYELAPAGIKLPTGRYIAEETLSEAYPLLVRPYLLSIKADSNSVLGDLVKSGELSYEELDSLCQESGKINSSLSADLTRMTGRFSLLTEKISSLLLRHRRSMEPSRPLIPAQAANYTGIIIIADKELPVHGRMTQALLEPCLFPKIWDTNMNLIYERNMIEPGSQRGAQMLTYTAPETVFRPTPSGLEGELAALAGPNPLRIFARGVYGINPTDPVIDQYDALQILSTENNRRLLREGRVVLVLNEGMLKTAF